MPSGKKTTTRKPLPKARRKKKQQKKHRGPLMRFKFGKLVLLWILALIICFGSYIYNRNYHPEIDVFVKPAGGDTVAEAVTTAATTTTTEVTTTATEAAADVTELTVTETTSGADVTTELTTVPVTYYTNKINPVPESYPVDAKYLTKCAFLGETNIHNLGQAGLLQPYSVYASEKLRLTNYSKEYVMLDGTTIRILSAINSAKCPIYLMFGTESLSTQPPDQTADQFDVLLKSVRATAPEATIYVLSIPPVTQAAEQSAEPIKNSDIDTYNSMLLDIANKNDVYYIDTNTALKNNDSRLEETYAEEDGIHLNTLGGQVLLNYVLTHMPVEINVAGLLAD